MKNISENRLEDTSSSAVVRKKWDFKEIPQELLDAVEFDGIVGELKWKTTGKGRRKDRRIVTHHYQTGHVYVCFKRQKYLVHRVIWTMVNGRIPDGAEIDHKNCVSHDNRLDNLRLATVSQNHANARIKRHSTNPYKGIYRNGPSWSATIMKNRIRHYLGSYDTPEKAATAYAAAAVRLSGEFARAV